MRDPNRPALNRLIARVMRQLDGAERQVGHRMRGPIGMYVPKGITSRMSETSEDYKAFITPADIGGRRTTEAETRELASALPCDWVMFECSRLLRILEKPGMRDIDPQRVLVREWAPAEVRRLIEQHVDGGAIFLHYEQLLAAMRLAVEYGSARATSPLAQRMQDFSWLLLSLNDRLSDEGPPENATEDDLTAYGLRAMGFASTQVLWHILARAEATWFTVRELLRGSTKYFPIDEEFERRTGARLSAYTAAITATFGHTQGASPENNWTASLIAPQQFFARGPDPTGMRRAQDLLVGSREWYRTQFARRASPRYAGIAMTPLRQRPLYQMENGRVVTLSARFLVERALGGVYWTIADGLSGEPRRRNAFTDFVGEIHERYVYELVHSSVDPRINVEVVYSDAEATPAKSGADTVVLARSSGVFLETTSTGLRLDTTLLPADLAAFDQEARDKIVKKILQLEEAVRQYRSGAIRYPTGSDAARFDRTIWPAVVLREPFPTFFLIAKRLAGLLAAASPAATVRADPPVRLLSSEDLELALRHRKPDRLRELLREWRMDDAYRDESFRNFYLHRHGAEGGSDAPFLTTAHEDAFLRVGRELGMTLNIRRGT